MKNNANITYLHTRKINQTEFNRIHINLTPLR